MLAVITSIGEATTDLCEWSLKRNGFEVKMVYNEVSTLWEKLDYIYQTVDEDFLRVDADVVVNKECNPDNIKNILREDYLANAWWVQFSTYDWYQQNVGFGGIQFIKKEALPVLRENSRHFKTHDRPETELSRSHGMYNPRRFESCDRVMGLHNYKNDLKRVAKQKSVRGQSHHYDYDLAQRLLEI